MTNENELSFPTSLVAYDSGYIAICTQNQPGLGAGSQVVLVGNDDRPKHSRVTDLMVFILRVFVRRRDHSLRFPTSPTDMLHKRFRVIVVEEPRYLPDHAEEDEDYWPKFLPAPKELE